MKRYLNCMEEHEEGFISCPICGYNGGDTRNTSLLLKEGTILQGRYIVGTCQDIRACDITYIGWDALFERKVLIQEFFPERYVERKKQEVAVNPGLEQEYAEALERFVIYQRKLIQLYKEEDIAEIYSCFKENKTAYAISQYSAAATFGEWFRREPERAPEEAVAFLYQACRALKKVHHLGVIHGDVRLDNFWITGTRQLVLKGFGEHCYYQKGSALEEPAEDGTWLDVYGVALMTGSLLSAKPDMEPEELEACLEKNNGLFPRRLEAALKGGLGMEGSEPIDTLDEFYQAVFADEETRKQETIGEKESDDHGSRREGRGRCGLAVKIGLLLTFLAIILVFSAVRGMSDKEVSAGEETLYGLYEGI